MRCLAIWLLLSAAAFGQTAISNLPNTTTAEPSDRTAVWMVLDDTSANQTRKINLRQLNLFTDVRKTTGAITAGGNTWSDPVLKDFVRAGQWIVVNAYTTNAEMRLITNVTVNTITVHRAFVRSHSIGSTVVIADSAERNVKWWGAKGDKTTNDSPAIQAAVDDFDTEILASRESRGNNLFFPPGEYVIGSMVRLPIITPYATSRQSISGHNATLITNSYNGPFFASRYSGTPRTGRWPAPAACIPGRGECASAPSPRRSGARAC